ncbi:SOS response-associated peptidase [Natronomonas amylolytica]|uniref:SOS response-associated peptidase n=1 Tax=Natronomonas amylolytica TaxID=3108498 RepID=UPI00300AF7E9
MCGRYSLFTPPSELESRFDAAFDSEFEPRYNAAPSQQLPVITDEASESFQRLEWGLLPEWADESDEGHINARAETVDEKPAFAEAYERRRCIVPADGFYEWADRGDGKRPYRVAYEDDRPFGMAGLWERWTPDTQQTGLDAFGGGGADHGEADPIETFTILTTEPNSVVEPLHHRMAVILDPEEERAWLDGEDVPLDPAPTEGFRSYPVSTAVNNPANDRAELVQPVDG